MAYQWQSEIFSVNDVSTVFSRGKGWITAIKLQHISIIMYAYFDSKKYRPRQWSVTGVFVVHVERSQISCCRIRLRLTLTSHHRCLVKPGLWCFDWGSMWSAWTSLITKWCVGRIKHIVETQQENNKKKRKRENIHRFDFLFSLWSCCYVPYELLLQCFSYPPPTLLNSAVICK